MLSDFDQVPDWQVDRLVAWHYLRHPAQARDLAVTGLRDIHGVQPEQGVRDSRRGDHPGAGMDQGAGGGTLGCG